ncbi:hypothetical protein CTI12_AA089750 [Artemisia annua]|uniref:Uncharacterized protein n=1 Tax=Artemisia annua TaxID=35608 RepID=A0A2U1PZQ1_ARTAN|nr:hypothetical protein CTI12_AA089750 [Artemisia annua]
MAKALPASSRGKEDLHSFHSFSARGEARPTTNEGGKLALLAVALFLGLGKGRKERWSLLLGTWLVHSLAHELAASPEATKGGPRPGKGRVAEWSKAADCKSVEVFLRRFESCLSHLFVVDFIEEKRGIRQRRKANRAKLLWPFREVQLYRMLVRERLGNASLIEDWRGEVEEKARDEFRSLCASRMRVVVGPTHPICSMIYGSTGATHFDQLAKILTGYEITGARSSGIFMGILSIAVGSLFKITAVPFRAANHATHAAGVLPAREERKKSDKVKFRFDSAQKKNRLEVRGPLVLYSTPEPAAFAPSKTALVPFLYPFRLLLCFVPIESKAKLKWFVCLLYLLDERERTEFRFRVYGLDSVSLTPSFLCCRDGYRRTLPKATLSSFRLFSRLK